ncbi:MAG: Uncharacterized protein family UPF0005 [Phormidesmis priestleyi Ana]|uniref:Uncharacterized protein family UPF0005 n=1 Tax=Phormidesmis priestleyi Ana TaxID=1666911 RepID=A0A0P7ZQD5_9CYAN|nr:MAG: Uncharacterized protein family UPF0005 [Phormidesmis priestleyi Ana]
MQSNRVKTCLTAYYKITPGLFFLVGGGTGFLISLWLAFNTQSMAAQALLGALLFVSVLAFGIYCLKRPYFLLEPRQLTVYNLLGTVTKRYSFESWDVVKADSRRIYIDNAGITIKVAVAPWLVKSEDWLAMRQLL